MDRWNLHSTCNNIVFMPLISICPTLAEIARMRFEIIICYSTDDFEGVGDNYNVTKAHIIF